MRSNIGVRSKNNLLKSCLLFPSEAPYSCPDRPAKSPSSRSRVSVWESSDRFGNKNNHNTPSGPQCSPSIRFSRSNKWNSGDVESVPCLTKACFHTLDNSAHPNLCPTRNSATLSGRIQRSGRSTSAPGNEDSLPRIRCFTNVHGDVGRFNTPASRCASTPAVSKANVADSSGNFTEKPRGCGLFRGASEPGRRNEPRKTGLLEMTGYLSHRSQSHPSRPTTRSISRVGNNWWSRKNKDSKPPWFPAGRGGTAVSHHRQFQTISKSVRVSNFLYKIATKGCWDGPKWPSSSPTRSFMTIGFENLPAEACARAHRFQSNPTAPNYSTRHRSKQNLVRKQPCLFRACSTLSKDKCAESHTNLTRQTTVDRSLPVNHSKQSTILSRLTTGLVRPNVNRWTTNDNAESPEFRQPAIQSATLAPFSNPVQKSAKKNTGSIPFRLHAEFSNGRGMDLRMRPGITVKVSSKTVTSKNTQSTCDKPKLLHHTQEQEGAQWDSCIPCPESEAPVSPDPHSLNFHTISARSLTSLDLDVVASSCILNVSGDVCANNDEDTLELPRNTLFVPGPEPFACQNSSPASTSHGFSAGPVTYASLWDRTYDCPTLSDGISSECLMASSSTHPSRTSPLCANRAEEAWCDTLINRGSTRLKALSQETLVHVTDVSELTDNQYSSMASKAHSPVDGDCENENGSCQVTQDVELCDATTWSSLNDKNSAPHLENRPRIVENRAHLISKGDCSLHQTLKNSVLLCPQATQSIPVVSRCQPDQITSATKPSQSVVTSSPQKFSQWDRSARSGSSASRVKGISPAEEQSAFTRTRGRRRFLRKLKRTVRIISSGRKKSVVHN